MKAVIDIGSNTIILGVYDLSPDRKRIDEIIILEEILGLRNYYKENFLTKEGIQALVGVLGQFKKLCSKLGVVEIYPFATASLRRADNPDEVLAFVKEKLDLDIDLISGQDEARLGFDGICMDYDLSRAYILDIGGGSTELIYVDQGQIKTLKSVDLGTVVLYGGLEGIFPSASELRDIEAQIKLFYENFDTRHKGMDLIGIGGNNLHVHRLAQVIYDLDTPYVEYSYIEALKERVMAQDTKLLKDIARISPSRLHLLCLSILLTEDIMARTQAPRLYVSKKGLKEGYLANILSKS